MDKTEEKENADNPHVFKTKYSKDELEELLQWFEARKGALPQTLRLNSSTSTNNLPGAVAALTDTIREYADGSNITYNGYIAHLELIRLRLREMEGK